LLSHVIAGTGSFLSALAIANECHSVCDECPHMSAMPPFQRRRACGGSLTILTPFNRVN
jgi:hypothetical protein